MKDTLFVPGCDLCQDKHNKKLSRMEQNRMMQSKCDDWHCCKCSALLCTVCGTCPKCKGCQHVPKVKVFTIKWLELLGVIIPYEVEYTCGAQYDATC